VNLSRYFLEERGNAIQVIVDEGYFKVEWRLTVYLQESPLEIRKHLVVCECRTPTGGQITP